MLEFQRVSAGYQGRPDVVRDLTFSVARGEWVALMGANGCGKSTVARLACGLAEPAAGSVVRPSVGYVAQHPEANIVGDTLFEDVAYALLHDGFPEESLRRIVFECLELVGLSGREARSMHALSGGELQRAAVAAALAAGAELLVLDEPTSHLPRREAAAFCLDLRRAASSRGMSVLYVTHSPEEAGLADRVIVLAQGRIALEGRPRGVFSHGRVLEWLGVRNDLGGALRRILAARGLAERAELDSEGLERLVERVCLSLLT